MEEKIIIYADGACRGNQNSENIGGYGAVLIYKENIKEIKDAFKNTTNNKMELLAVIKSLENLKKFDIPVEVYSDSQYVVNTINLGWAKRANQDLWVWLEELISKFKSIKFIKVKGHSGDKYNELADKLCNEAMDSLRGK